MQPGSNIKDRNARVGFTLIELLVVISIIVMLVTILVPSIARVMSSASKAQSRTRISVLDSAIHAYKADNYCFPGQDDTTPFTDSGGAYYRNASAFLAVELQAGKYAEFKASDILANGAISDRFSRPMGLAYYPSLLGASGVDQYVYNDNEAITTVTDWNAADFATYITDNRFGGTTPYRPELFLLIGASTEDPTNRTYGGDNTLINFK